MSLKIPILILLSMIILGCSSPPIQEMSDARQTILDAREAGADVYAPAQLGIAEKQLSDAEKDLQNNDFRNARSRALSAKNDAMGARQLAIALAAAKSAIELSSSHGKDISDALEIFNKAQEAASNQKINEAIDLANQAIGALGTHHLSPIPGTKQ